MANGLYTTKEISVMTDDALDELLSHYSDTGNAEGVRLVQQEIDDRVAWAEEARAEEAEHDARQEADIRSHYEMLESQGIFV